LARAMTEYAFEGQTVRLNQRDYDEWRRVFWAIPDFDAELFSLDVYYTGEGVKNWYIRCSRALLKAHNRGLQNDSASETTNRRRAGLAAAAMAGGMDDGTRRPGEQRGGPERASGSEAGALRLVGGRDSDAA
jgi:hypothetical protein